MKSIAAAGGQRSIDSTVAWNVVFTLLAAAGLFLKARYSGPQMELVHSYGGNVVASFAVYFILATSLSRLKFGRALRAVLALGVVELFEATDGFKVMSNTYDSTDYLANGVGIVLALLVDAMATRVAGSGPARNA
jgi:hypothetical protein